MLTCLVYICATESYLKYNFISS